MLERLEKSSVQGALETAWKIDLDWEGDNGNIFDVFIEDDEGDDLANTNSVFMFAMSQSFLLLRYFEDEKEKPFFADYFICRNFDKST